MPGERIQAAGERPQAAGERIQAAGERIQTETSPDALRVDTLVQVASDIRLEAVVPVEIAADEGLGAAAESRSCTAAQLRRFIKSRPYVPMHELRRRFELIGGADEVSSVQTSLGMIYVGLPRRESLFIADLVNQGDIGVELCRDPRVSIVMGVYAMRPITR